jgi:hypothetical protein
MRELWLGHGHDFGLRRRRSHLLMLAQRRAGERCERRVQAAQASGRASKALDLRAADLVDERVELRV